MESVFQLIFNHAFGGYDTKNVKVYFRCIEGEFDHDSSQEWLTGYVEKESKKHCCIDYSQGTPVYVRGRYSMVSASALLRFLRILIAHRRAATLKGPSI